MKTLILIGLMLLQSCAHKPMNKRLAHHQINDNLELVEFDSDTYILKQIRYPAPANGIFIRVGLHDWVLVDPPRREKDAQDFIHWIKDQLQGDQLTVINTHTETTSANLVFYEKNIPLMMSRTTASLLKEKDLAHLVSPYLFGLRQELEIKIGATLVKLIYPGPGKSQDNILVFFPHKRLLYASHFLPQKEEHTRFQKKKIDQWLHSLQELKKIELPIKTLIIDHGDDYEHWSLEKTESVLRQSILN